MTNITRCESLWPFAGLSDLFNPILDWKVQKWTQRSRCLTSADYKGRITSLKLLATLYAMHPRMLLTYLGAKGSLLACSSNFKKLFLPSLWTTYCSCFIISSLTILNTNLVFSLQINLVSSSLNPKGSWKRKLFPDLFCTVMVVFVFFCFVCCWVFFLTSLP